MLEGESATGSREKIGATQKLQSHWEAERSLEQNVGRPKSCKAIRWSILQQNVGRRKNFKATRRQHLERNVGRLKSCQAIRRLSLT